jgi:hypothetical protein
MKQINLLEILIKHIPTELYDPGLDKYYLSAMLEACEDTVDLCAENADIDMKKRSQYGKYRKRQNTKEGEDVDLFSYEVKYLVDEESILKVKKLIK